MLSVKPLKPLDFCRISPSTPSSLHVDLIPRLFFRKIFHRVIGIAHETVSPLHICSKINLLQLWIEVEYVTASENSMTRQGKPGKHLK